MKKVWTDRKSDEQTDKATEAQRDTSTDNKV